MRSLKIWLYRELTKIIFELSSKLTFSGSVQESRVLSRILKIRVSEPSLIRWMSPTMHVYWIPQRNRKSLVWKLKLLTPNMEFMSSLKIVKKIFFGTNQFACQHFKHDVMMYEYESGGRGLNMLCHNVSQPVVHDLTMLWKKGVLNTYRIYLAIRRIF